MTVQLSHFELEYLRTKIAGDLAIHNAYSPTSPWADETKRRRLQTLNDKLTLSTP